MKTFRQNLDVSFPPDSRRAQNEKHWGLGLICVSVGLMLLCAEKGAILGLVLGGLVMIGGMTLTQISELRQTSPANQGKIARTKRIFPILLLIVLARALFSATKRNRR